MTLAIVGVLGDAWRAWRRDRDLLVRIAGPLIFLPSFTLALLVPPATAATAVADAGPLAQMQAMSQFVTAHLGSYLGALIVTKLGEATLFALYCDPAARDVGSALRRGLMLLPRYLLASLLLSVAAFAGLFVLIVGYALVAARTLVTGPVLFAEQPVGAAQALARAVRLTRGQWVPLVGLWAIEVGARFVLVEPFAAIDQGLRSAGADNPVAIALVDALSSVADAAVTLAAVLVAVALYRRLVAASSGT